MKEQRGKEQNKSPSRRRALASPEGSPQLRGSLAMSPPGGPRCPPALLALLLALVRSQDPIPEPSLQSQILEWDRGWCLLSLLCSSPGDGNVSISWECPEDLPEFLEFPGSPSQRFQWVPEDAEPQMCLCNLSNAAGWRAAPAPLTCTGISGNFGLSAALGVSVGLILILILGFCCWRREEGEILGMVS